MITTHAIAHLTRRALTLTLLAALGGCYLLDPTPPVRPGATEDFDAVVAKIKEIDGVGPQSSFHYTDSGVESGVVSADLDVEDGYNPIRLIDAALHELYWFGEYAPAPVDIAARTTDGQWYDLRGPIRDNQAPEQLYSDDMERYGP